MSDDAAGLVLLFLAAWAVAVAAVVAAVVAAALLVVGIAGYGLFVAGRFVASAIRGRLALRLIRWRRNRAIRSIRSLGRSAAAQLAYRAHYEEGANQHRIRDAL